MPGMAGEKEAYGVCPSSEKTWLSKFRQKPVKHMKPVMDLCYTPVDIWKEKFAKHGLYEAIENMSEPEEF